MLPTRSYILVPAGRNPVSPEKSHRPPNEGRLCVGGNPEQLFPRVAAWLDNQDQNQDVEYENLKSYLLQEFTLSVSARAQKLLSLPHIPLGDTTAHAAWNEMQALATLPDLDPTTNKPRRVGLDAGAVAAAPSPSVRSALHEADDSPINDLIKKAAISSMLPEHLENLTQPTLHPPRTSLTSMLLTSDDPTHRFGAGAHKCLPGCQWPKTCNGATTPAKVATQNRDAGTSTHLTTQHRASLLRTPYLVANSSHSRKQNSFLDTTSNVKLVAANGSPIPMYGIQTIPIQAAGRSFTWDFIIADVKTPLLGADFLGHHGLLVDVANPSAKSTQTFFDQNSVSSLDSQPNMEYSITSKRQALRYTQNSGFYLQRSFKQLNKLTPKWNGWASVKKASSPWASPLHLVRKPEGTWRPCGL
ncbi:Transposon Ty3-G Gag-Pol polyprotein [Penaeus vannamei]|uniref:Transposon Ty3-G Gag-Pol polyprotein n=1 Tax=Penaeus vannamei TaxID=6689 RepID=A0A3R7PWW8_PENVA|nr:Transposon Ty3-G Gag-Pol polyprotein [Penaeus vannamei]